jgi:hypothetical protein
MKSKFQWTAVAIALGLAGAVSINVYAAPGGNGGGGGNAGTAAGALYGDLYVIERNGNGEPMLRSKTLDGVTYTCQQPLAAGCSFLPLNFDKENPPFDPETEDACAVQTDSTDLLQAVTFGRESVSRAPATVIDKSYAEALKSINLAEPSCDESRAIKLDPAGRITMCIAQEGTGTAAGMPIDAPRIGRALADAVYAWKTIDAPLENLGLYRATMTNGCFGPVSEEIVTEEGVRETVTTELSPAAKGYLTASGLDHLVCSGTLPNAVTKDDMLSSAVFIAAGADKSSPVTLDQIINVNNYLGVNTWTYTRAKNVKTLTIDYFDFKVSGGPGGWFGYTNGEDACDPDNPDNTVSLLTATPWPTLTPDTVSVFGGSPPGVDLSDAAVTVCRAGSPLNAVCDDAVNNPVYSSNDINGCGGANWFAQAAEDARKTIWYLHNWRLPVNDY